jgi:hypothetical protein
MSEVTRILSAIEQGDPHAAEQLLPLVYGELRKLAAAKLAQEKPGQTLEATALVHEGQLRAARSNPVPSLPTPYHSEDALVDRTNLAVPFLLRTDGQESRDRSVSRARPEKLSAGGGASGILGGRVEKRPVTPTASTFAQGKTSQPRGRSGPVVPRAARSPRCRHE